MNLTVKELAMLLLAFVMGTCALVVPNYGKEFALIGAGLGVFSGGAFMIFLYLKFFTTTQSTSKE